MLCFHLILLAFKGWSSTCYTWMGKLSIIWSNLQALKEIFTCTNREKKNVWPGPANRHSTMAAFRSVASKISGCALQRPQAVYPAATLRALEEGQRQPFLPRLTHGGLLRRPAPPPSAASRLFSSAGGSSSKTTEHAPNRVARCLLLGTGRREGEHERASRVKSGETRIKTRVVSKNKPKQVQT